MALQQVYEFLEENNLTVTDNFLFSQIIARHIANLPHLPEISISCEELIVELEEDLHDYSPDEKVWVYFSESSYIEGIYYPSDYLLENHDELDELDYHIEMNLLQALTVFKLLDMI